MTYAELETMTYADLEMYTYAQLEVFYAIFDRAQTDIDNLTAKGYFNASDMNRIEDEMKRVCDLIGIAFTVKVWTENTIPDVDDYKRIEDVANTVKASQYYTLINTPIHPYNSFSKWNTIERIFFEIYALYQRMLRSLSYVGEIYVGEYGLL